MKKQDPAPLGLCHFTASRVCYSVKPASGPACPSVCQSAGLRHRELLVVLYVGVAMATHWQLMELTVHTDTKKQMFLVSLKAKRTNNLIRFAVDTWDFHFTLSSKWPLPSGSDEKVLGWEKLPNLGREGFVHEPRLTCEEGLWAQLHLFASTKCTWEPAAKHRRKNTLAQGDVSEDDRMLRWWPSVTTLKSSELASESRRWGRRSPPPHRHHHLLHLLMEGVSTC